jgi:hypothetical protein
MAWEYCAALVQLRVLRLGFLQNKDVHRPVADDVLQRRPAQELHGDESLPALLVDLVDCANVGMVQGRGGLRLALEAAQGLRIAGNFVGNFKATKRCSLRSSAL